MKKIGVFIITALFFWQVFACTVFWINRDGLSFGAANEDGAETRMLIISEPPNNGNNGYVLIEYTTEGVGVQLGVNEKGLFFDGLAAPAVAVEPDPERPQGSWQKLMVDILEQFESADDALAYKASFDTSFAGQEAGFMIFGDRLGRAGVVEPDGKIITNGEKDFFVAANFYLSDPDIEGSGGFDHYNTAEWWINDIEELNVQSVRDILRAVKQGITRISVVYDLDNAVLYIYSERNYDEVAVFDMKEWFKKGFQIVYADELEYVSHDELFADEMDEDVEDNDVINSDEPCEQNEETHCSGGNSGCTITLM